MQGKTIKEAKEIKESNSKLMKKVYFSIIVPVFNVEKYLRQCIDSVLNQTYSDYELILIDDGSTDASQAIEEEYANKDKRIIIIKSNHCGPSGARNKGLEIAKGEYICFLDSDDYWKNNHLEHIADRIKGSEAVDMCISNNVVSAWSDRKVSNDVFPYYEGINNLPCQDKLAHIFSLKHGMPSSMWLSVYFSDFLKNNKIRFNEELRVSVDTDFFLRAISSVSNIIFDNEEFYYWRQDNAISVSKNMTPEKYCDRLEIYRYWQQVFEKRGYDADAVISKRLEKCYKSTFDEVLDSKMYKKQVVYAYLKSTQKKWGIIGHGMLFNLFVIRLGGTIKKFAVYVCKGIKYRISKYRK